MKNVVAKTKSDIRNFAKKAALIMLALDIILVLLNLKSLQTFDENFWVFNLGNLLFIITYCMFCGIIIEQNHIAKLRLYKTKLKVKKSFFYFKRSYELLLENNFDKSKYFYKHIPKTHDFYIGYLSGLSLAKYPDNPLGHDVKTFSNIVDNIYNEDISY